MVAAAAEMATSGDEALDPDGPRPVTEAPQHALLPEEDIDQHSQDLDEAAAAAAGAATAVSDSLPPKVASHLPPTGSGGDTASVGDEAEVGEVTGEAADTEVAAAATAAVEAAMAAFESDELEAGI
mmetsp:Transcript_2249/g.5598  ORF Transcript_2249/g.5598 Transcript_2249/m.5598 type:complete len:126 (+) Transcript_2249:1346-1723(+)